MLNSSTNLPSSLARLLFVDVDDVTVDVDVVDVVVDVVVVDDVVVVASGANCQNACSTNVA